MFRHNFRVVVKPTSARVQSKSRYLYTTKPSSMPSTNTSLSTTSAPPSSPHRLPSDFSILRPQNVSSVTAASRAPPITESVTIKVLDSMKGAVPAVLHLPSDNEQSTQSAAHRTAAILLSGASGGLVGPSAMYLGMAAKLASLHQGIPVMRLDYRYPARNKYCVADVQAAMKYMELNHQVSKFVLVGWSFGGAPVFTVGGNDQRVVGCATVASQTAETAGMQQVAPRPVLLLHGAADQTLDPWCSEQLYERYGNKGDRELKLFEGDNHALTKNAAKAEELLCRFVMKCAGVRQDEGEEQLVKEILVGREERVKLMEKAGDLNGEERLR
ncbi:MAG: hypothetical protein Q9218_006336 [Villophora microphyllina]